MIDLVKDKLNLVVGKVDSGKSAVVLNTVKDAVREDLNVIIFTTDSQKHQIQKRLYCLINGKNPSEIKVDPKTFEPIDTDLPENITIIDDSKNIEDIKATVREYSRAWLPHIIVIDNINFLEDYAGQVYSTRIQKIIDDLNDYSSTVTVLATFNLLKVFETYVEDINTDKMGNLILISRYGNSIDVHEDHTGITSKYNFMTNSRLVMEGMEETA